MSNTEMPTVMIGQIVNIKIREVNLRKINALTHYWVVLYNLWIEVLTLGYKSGIHSQLFTWNLFTLC